MGDKAGLFPTILGTEPTLSSALGISHFTCFFVSVLFHTDYMYVRTYFYSHYSNQSHSVRIKVASSAAHC